MASVSLMQQVTPASKEPPSPGGKTLRELNFLDIQMHAVEMPEFCEIIANSISQDRKYLIAHHNLHSLYLWQAKAKERVPGSFSRFYKRADLTLIDGMSMVWLARLHGFPVCRNHRIAYNQALPKLLSLAETKKWRVFYLGSSKDVAVTGAALFRKNYPDLELAVQHGYFNKDRASRENHAVLERIAEFQPHILFVGMGMPVQERWIEENFDMIKANVILSSGATLDYFSGTLSRPPEWVGKVGLEWAYRLVHEPRRLAFRYLVEPWLILLTVFGAKLKHSGRREEAEGGKAQVGVPYSEEKSTRVDRAA